MGILLVISTTMFLTCSATVRDHSAGKRTYSDPEDPRNLFASMYGGVYKRGVSDPEDPRNLFANMYGGVFKRAAWDEEDPRNLFKAMYGANYKRSMSGAGLAELYEYLQQHKRGAGEDPRNLF